MTPPPSESRLRIGATPKLLAVDPGPRTCGVCVLWLTSPLATYCAGGSVRAEPDDLRALLDRHRPTCLAIEAVGLAYRLEARHCLVETASVAGLIRGLAVGLGVARGRIVTLTAQDWRRVLIGTRMQRRPAAEQDAAVGEVVRRRIVAFPERSSVHARDAAGLALVAAWRIRLGRAA